MFVLNGRLQCGYKAVSIVFMISPLSQLMQYSPTHAFQITAPYIASRKADYRRVSKLTT